MRKSRILLCLLLVFCIVSVLSVAAFAEPEATESSGENEGGTSSEETKVVISVTGDTKAVKVYFNGSETPAASYTAEEDEEVTFRVEANEDYEVTRIKVGSGLYKLNETNTIIASGSSMSIQISATFTGEVSEDSSEDPSGDTSSESSDDTSSDDTSSDDTSSDDTSSDDTSSDDTSSEEPHEGIPFRVTIVGPGTVTVNDQAITNSGSSSLHQTIYLPESDEAQRVTVKIAPSIGYRTSSILLDGNGHSIQSEMVLNITNETTVAVVFAPEQEAPTDYEVRISCTNVGGYVSAGGFDVTQGSSKSISVRAGGSLTIGVYPSEGYEVDTFTVGGQVQNLSNRTYVLSNIASNVSVTVSFKRSAVVSTTVEASDLNWSPNADGIITLDLSGKSSIGLSVFEKINTLSSGNGDYVMLSTDYIRWYIPCGAKVVSLPSGAIKLTIAMNANSSQYNSISSAFLAQSPEAIFNFYEVTGLPILPDGTLVSYNMLEKGAAYNGNTVIQYSKQTVIKDGQTKTSLVPGTQAGKVSADGWTSLMPYANSTIFIACIQPASSYNLHATVQGVGGTITPSGENTVSKDGSMSFRVSADAGYIISAVYVDGKAVAGAATELSFEYLFSGVTADHSISATFIPAATKYTVKDNVAVPVTSDSSEAEEPANVGLIVSLIVIAIAVIGAAALFIVKYRQERF